MYASQSRMPWTAWLMIELPMFIRAVLISFLSSFIVCGPIHAETPPKVDKKLKRSILKRLKESERERFQHHNMSEFLLPYADDFTVTHGRKATAGPHDYKLNRKQKIAQIKREWKTKLTGSEDLFFTKTQVMPKRRHRGRSDHRVSFFWWSHGRIETLPPVLVRGRWTVSHICEFGLSRKT